MPLYIPGTADPGDVLAGKTYSAKDKYIALGTMPLKIAQMEMVARRTTTCLKKHMQQTVRYISDQYIQPILLQLFKAMFG